MKTITRLSILLSSVLFLSFYCPQYSSAQSAFVFDPVIVDVGSDGGSVTFELEFSGDPAYWTGSCDADWLTFDPMNGEDGTKITIEYAANEGIGRRAAIVFQTPGGELSEKSLYVRQYHTVQDTDLNFAWTVMELDPAIQEFMPYSGKMTMWFKAWEPGVFMNVLARKGPGGDPAWIIRNLYIPESAWFDDQQNLSSVFDLGLLGFSKGEPVEWLQFGTTFHLLPDTTLPDIPDPFWREAIFELEKQRGTGYFGPSGGYNGYPLIEFFPKGSLTGEVTKKHYIGCEMPNGQLDGSKAPWQANACGPAAAANSLMWLRDKHKEIDFPGEFDQICYYLAALMGKRANGVGQKGFVQGKLDFIEMYKLPIKVKFQTKKLSGDQSSNTGNSKAEKKDKSSDTHPDKDWIYEELKNGEDVELGYIKPGTGEGHITTMTGTYTVDGKTYLYFKDDGDQLTGDTTKMAQGYSVLERDGDSIWRMPGKDNGYIDFVVSESFDPDHSPPANNSFFSKYCETFRRVLAPGRSITLQYPEMEGRNFNTTVRILDKVRFTDFFTMGMWVNNSGGKRKITNRLEYPVIVEFHNDDRSTGGSFQKTAGWWVEIDEQDDPDGVTDPNNESESAGFSVGTDDDSNAEFGDPVGHEMTYVDSLLAHLSSVPNGMSAEGVHTFHLIKEVPVWSRYWRKLELVLGVEHVLRNGNLYITSQALNLSDTIGITHAGEYSIPLGGLDQAGTFDLTLKADNTLSFTLDNLGVPTLVPILADMEIQPKQFDLPAEETVDTTFTISNPGGLDMSWQLTYSANWFAVSPRYGDNETDVRLFVVPNQGIPRKDSIRVVAPGVAHNIQYVVVTQDGDRSGIGLINKHELQVDCYPNPAGEMVHVKVIQADAGPIELTILNQLGAVVLEDYLQTSTRELVHELALNHLPDGIYFLIVKSAQKQSIQKLLKLQD